MDPTTVFCPNLACSARGHIGQGNIGIHSQKDQRFICTQCRKTFSATKGTVFYRLRTAAETVALVVTLLAHGCPVQAMVAACGCDARTVAAWWARSGRQGQAVPCVALNVLWHSVQRKRLFLREWRPMVPRPVCPLAGHAT